MPGYGRLPLAAQAPANLYVSLLELHNSCTCDMMHAVLILQESSELLVPDTPANRRKREAAKKTGRVQVGRKSCVGVQITRCCKHGRGILHNCKLGTSIGVDSCGRGRYPQAFWPGKWATLLLRFSLLPLLPFLPVEGDTSALSLLALRPLFGLFRLA